MTTHWRDNGPEGWHVPFMLPVPDECPCDAGDTAEGPTAWMITLQGISDRARLPPELGGGELLVRGQVTTEPGVVRCRNCDDAGEKLTLVLEQGYAVAQCSRCRQYSWFKREEKKPDANG